MEEKDVDAIYESVDSMYEDDIDNEANVSDTYDEANDGKCSRRVNRL